MSSVDNKADFLRNRFVPLLEQLDPTTEQRWGKMNVQQMIEHMSYAMRQASGKELYELITKDEYLPRMQAFLLSEKPFKENTPNSLLPDTPDAPKHETIKDSVDELRKDIDHFFDVYSKEPDKKLTNPFFGELDYNMQVQLLHKHALHHLKQFGIEEA